MALALFPPQLESLSSYQSRPSCTSWYPRVPPRPSFLRKDSVNAAPNCSICSRFQSARHVLDGVSFQFVIDAVPGVRWISTETVECEHRRWLLDGGIWREIVLRGRWFGTFLLSYLEFWCRVKMLRSFIQGKHLPIRIKCLEVWGFIQSGSLPSKSIHLKQSFAFVRLDRTAPNNSSLASFVLQKNGNL